MLVYITLFQYKLTFHFKILVEIFFYLLTFHLSFYFSSKLHEINIMYQKSRQGDLIPCLLLLKFLLN